MIKPGTRTFEFGPDDSIGVNAEGQLVTSLDNGPEMPAAGVLATPANWDITVCRYFLLDPINGNDRNVGFVDATNTSTTTINPAGKAKATVAGLLAIIPPVGNGKIATVLQGPGTITEDINLRGITGYRRFLWRGSTDLTNDANDKIICGGVVAIAGPGAAGEFTVDAGATTLTIPIAVGSFGAEPAAVMYRIRFLPTTTTVALRNQCRNIYSHTATVLTLSSAVSNVPVAGDVFVIDKPGAVVNGIAISRAGAGDITNIAGLGFSTIANSTVMLGNGKTRVSFIELSGVTTNTVLLTTGMEDLNIDISYTNEFGSNVITYAGLRMLSQFYLNDIKSCMLRAFGAMNTASGGSINRVAHSGGGSGSVGLQSYFARCPRFTNCGATTMAIGGQVSNLIFGSGAGATPTTRVVGAPTSAATTATISGCNIAIRNIEYTNQGATIPINIDGCGCVVAVDGCTGSTGNTNVGINVLGSQCIIALGQSLANTVTGTSGDIQLAGPAIVSHAALTITNMTDQNGNQIKGSAIAVVDQCLLFTNGEATPLAVGEIVRVSATNTVVRAQADTAARSSGPLLVAVTTPAAGLGGYFVALNAPQKWMLHSAAPTLLSISYLNTTVAGQAATTIPPTSGVTQKLRLGHVAKVSGNLGLVIGNPDLLPVTADSLA